MSVGLSYPDFSARFVRIKYLAVASSLLVATCGKYGIKSFDFLKVVTLEKPPSGVIVFLGIWIFSIFNLYGFYQRYRFEKPLIPYTLMTLRTLLDEAKETFESSSKDHNLLVAEIDSYRKDYTKPPMPKFDGAKAAEISRSLYDQQAQLLPALRFLKIEMDDVANESAAHHFSGPKNYFTMAHKAIVQLTDYHEKIHSVANDLVEASSSHWPKLMLNGQLLASVHNRSKGCVDQLLERIPAREKIENSLTFTLAFNVPFWVSIALFIYGTLNFIDQNFNVFIEALKP